MNARFFAVAAALAAAGIAQADFIDVRFVGIQKGATVRVSSPQVNGNVFAGQLKHTLSDGPAALNGNWITFCTDLAQRTSGSTRQFEIVTVDALPDNAPMGTAKANAIADLFASANGAQLLSSTSDNLAAAFQLAVWEIVTDFDAGLPGFNLSITSGSFSATRTNGSALSSSLTDEISSLFAAVGQTGGNGVALTGLRSGTYQDQLVPAAVPAPGAAALAGLGSLLLASRRRAQ